MDKRTKMLLGELSSTDRDSRERAAALICNMRDIPFMKDIVNLLKDENPEVRIDALTVLAVVGGDSENRKIRKIMKSDVNINVRVAAFVALKYYGKRSFRELNRIVRNAVIDKVYKKKIEMHTQKGLFSLTSLKDVVLFRNKKQSAAVLGVVVTAVIIIVLVLLYTGESFFTVKQVKKKSVDREKMSTKIKQRIQDVQDFKEKALLPGGENSKNSITMSLETYYGDTYGDVVQRVYSAPEFQKSGMNTLKAFWRKHNFPTIRMQRKEDVMKFDTEDETLVFANLPAMRIQYSLEKGTAAEQVINKVDGDVKIQVTVDKVIVK